MRPVQVTSGRSPFEVTVLAAALLCGVTLLVSDARPRSVTETMPSLVQSLWEVGLILAGLVGLCGITLWGSQLAVALGVELGGVTILGAATAMYAIALFTVSGSQAVAAGAFITGVSVASWWRTGQIVRDLRRLAAVVEQRENET